MYFLIFYKQSLKYLLKLKLTWLLFFVYLVAMVFLLIIIPAALFQSMQDYYVSVSWIQTFYPAIMVVFALIFSLMGEQNALLSERVYILTKPIKKTSFLFSKFLSSFTICFAYILITMVFLFSVAACIYSTDMNFNIFNEKLCNVWGLFGSFICLGLFTCSFSLLFRYLFKPGLSAIFSVCLAALFLVIYSMFISIDANHPGPALWYTSITPSIVFFPLFLIVSAIGTYYFKNQEVAS